MRMWEQNTKSRSVGVSISRSDSQRDLKEAANFSGSQSCDPAPSAGQSVKEKIAPTSWCWTSQRL